MAVQQAELSKLEGDAPVAFPSWPKPPLSAVGHGVPVPAVFRPPRASCRPPSKPPVLLVREQEEEQEADHSKCASTKRISGFTLSSHESGISANSRPAQPTSEAARSVFFSW